MSNNNPIYSVVAYRYGEKKAHSYVVGFTRNYHLATLMAKNEENSRGGKYDCEVTKVNCTYPNTLDSMMVITHELEGYSGNEQRTYIEFFTSKKAFDFYTDKYNKDNKTYKSIYSYVKPIETEINFDDILDYQQLIYRTNNDEEVLLRDSYEYYLRRKEKDTIIFDIIMTTPYSETLDELFKIDNIYFKRQIAKRDIISEELIKKLFNEKDFLTTESLIENPNTPDEVFFQMHELNSLTINIKLANSLYTPVQILDKLAKDKETADFYQKKIVKNPNASPETLWYIYNHLHNDEKLKQIIISHRNFVSAGHILKMITDQE